ncbi:hypothetical protein FSP39_024727 [Pinctada imbricata]|uniref:Uncharacterized protein n=1 Tax=Pinctada imbricata TaxID=66713 RepID=A0AA88YAR9_PINIB|nr:hypothetical protein FSP39_024727 [Pinctada imbricata]
MQKGSKGSDVVEAVLDRIRSRCIFRDDRLFMRRLAIVSSEDGNDPNYDKDSSGGIWKIPRSRFESTQISNALDGFKDNIGRTFGIHWNAITYESLDIPLLSALATHLMIEGIGKDIKANSTEQAEYWALNWKNGADQRSSIQEFTSKINALQKPTCSKPVDLVFALDESGSVGSYNFVKMKQFLSDLTGELAIGYNSFQVGAVKFNSRGTENALNNIVYLGGGTSIAYGIKKAEDVFKNSTRNESNVVIFALGIGSINHAELNAAANTPNCTHKFVISDFKEIDSILFQIMKSTCEVSKPVNIENGTKVEVEVEITDDVVEDTIEISPGGDPTTSVEVEVECAEVDVYASINTNKPNEAFYDTKGKATEGFPAILQVENQGKKVYVTYKGSKSKLSRCSEDDGGFNITIEEGKPQESVTEIICRENGHERECNANDFNKLCHYNVEVTSSTKVPTTPFSTGCKSGTYSAHPSNKSMFRQCAHNKWVVHHCPAGLVFDITYNVCNWP